MVADLDAGGTRRLNQRVYLGPSLGWTTMPITSIKQITTAGTTVVDFGTTLVRVSVAGAVTVQLPTSIAGIGIVSSPITIEDSGGNAGPFPITILPFGSEQISGQNSIQINADYDSFTLVPQDGGGWIIEDSGVDFGDTTIVNVKAFGAKGDGVTDDSVAFQNAFNVASRIISGPIGNEFGNLMTGNVIIPPGDYVINTGVSIATLNLAIEGAGREVTRIRLGAGQVFLTVTGGVSQFDLSGITFVGGAGALNQTATGNNVQGKYIVKDNNFFDFTGTCIGTLSGDMPYWQVLRNVFFSASATSKAFVHAGNPDDTIIQGNSFLGIQYAIVLAAAGNTVIIRDNDFIPWNTPPHSYVNIWLIPGAAGQFGVNAGNQLIVRDNKFGNENLSTTDYRILLADINVASGANLFSQTHSTARSTGYLYGALILDNKIGNVGPPNNNGIIYSYSANVGNCTIINQGAAVLTCIVFDSSTASDFATDNRQQDSNIAGWRAVQDGGDFYAGQLSNQESSTRFSEDPQGLFQGRPAVKTGWEAGGDIAFQNIPTLGFNGVLVATNATGNMLNGGATPVQTTDVLGGRNASEITYINNSGYAYVEVNPSTYTVGRLAWIEIDVCQSASNSATQADIQLKNGAGNAVAVRRIVNVPTYWTTIRIPWIPRQNTNGQAVTIAAADFTAVTKVKFRVGRIRIYHAAQPVLSVASAYPRTVQEKINEQWTSVKEFGVLGDGVTDDTVNIQTAVTAVLTTSGGHLFFPPGNYIVSQPIHIPTSHGWKIAGADRGSTTITHNNKNQIFLFDSDNTYGWSISDLAFNFNPAAGPTDFNAYCILFGGGAFKRYDFVVERCSFNGAYIAILGDPANAVLTYGGSFRDLRFTACTGGAILLRQSVAALQPNNKLDGIYIDHTSGTAAAIELHSCDSFSIDHIEVENITTAQAFLCDGGTTGKIGTFKVKTGSWAGGAFGNNHVFQLASCDITINNLDVQNITVSTANTVYLFDESGGNVNLNVGNLKLAFTSIFAGGKFYVHNPAGSLTTFCRIGTLNGLISNALLTDGTSAAVSSVSVASWEQSRMSPADIGDANYTYNIGPSPNVLLYATTLTATRTVTLADPVGGTGNLYNGVKVRVVRSAAVPGAFVLNVVDSAATNIGSLASGQNGSIEFMWHVNEWHVVSFTTWSGTNP